eukprot:7109066-Karenia_brevis.AAC.1
MVVSRINDLNNQFDHLSRFVDDAISTWKKKYEKLDVRVDKLEARFDETTSTLDAARNADKKIAVDELKFMSSMLATM